MACCTPTIAQKPACPTGRRNSATTRFRDRKSTRLNSSHDQISYAVFCLKKKKHTECKVCIIRKITPVNSGYGTVSNSRFCSAREHFSYVSSPIWSVHKRLRLLFTSDSVY